MRFGCRSRYISRYVNLKFGFLPFVVASIVAMVFFSAVFAARAPAMGNSADRVWQLSQLVEGVSTAFNPSHGSLSCVETNCGVIRVAGYSVAWECISTSEFFPKAPKGALRPFLGRSAPSLRFMVRFGLFCCRQDFLSRFT